MKRWKNLARHETFNSVMAAVGAYGVVIAIFFSITSENVRTLVIGFVTPVFWAPVAGYFVWEGREYRKNNKKRKSIKRPPLVSEKKIWILIRPKQPKIAFASRIFFFTLEVIEATILLGFSISQWQIFTALSYQNLYVIAFLITGVLLASDIIRRLYNLKKFHSE